MKITEPSVMITDFLLAIFMGYWGIIIVSNNPTTTQVYWSGSFLLSSFGAIIGAISHGLKENFSEKTNQSIWTATTYSIGVASFMMLAGLITYFVDGTLNTILLIVDVISLITYLTWMSKHDEFIYVIMYYGPVMLIVLIANIVALISSDNSYSVNFILGVIIAVFAAVIQMSKKGLHKHFNNNDIFHILSIISGYFLYLGVINL